MTFKGHIDRAPRLLPHREQGEALLTIREAAPSAPSEEGIGLFAVPAGEVQGRDFNPLALSPALAPAGRAGRIDLAFG
ncbi:hypothetical protein [Streptomyces niveus]|uniref:hypothetical protein n=1 Tax=Streptomyces niveus TaxID=193462 RepID=UPI0003C60664|nr:hypothetical protein [Streptomyces niveus]EST26751.1 hypothetical protein M877_18240 [Streptomyces niveus NCIMB 11891]